MVHLSPWHRLTIDITKLQPKMVLVSYLELYWPHLLLSSCLIKLILAVSVVQLRKLFIFHVYFSIYWISNNFSPLSLLSRMAPLTFYGDPGRDLTIKWRHCRHLSGAIETNGNKLNTIGAIGCIRLMHWWQWITICYIFVVIHIGANGEMFNSLWYCCPTFSGTIMRSFHLKLYHFKRFVKVKQ